MSTSDKIGKAGTSVVAALSIWDRATAWWARRKERKAEAQRRAAHEAKVRVDIELQRISDDANKRHGTSICPIHGCMRPEFHTGDHGEAL